ncbi:MAG: electron transport complex subunit RsxC [Nitrosomonadales bacterium]|nr:electron transport complex subunit RsxC [Nitrosomonadales bacterium]MBT3918558.1 electron transport complex subunit RsxC [Nitrosomonadales bacterium]MBT4183269.1 electron transport complex subunit RsxC [Nitrosomonadales bacterium]MBT4571252.1 electron transport complex subunit RsxC [Nitrosomonadales bacterium]MBT4759070.1 electron transport complex subunit RsxC [Nitrosomonadales bacterium]
MKIIENIFKFNGGVKAQTRKSISTKVGIQKIGIPKYLKIPLRQHIGNLPKLKVKEGDVVLKGQLIAEADGSVSAAIHAPTSGKIKSIEKILLPHPSGLPDYGVIIESDMKDKWIKKIPINWAKIGVEATIKALQNSGIVGLGGAAFPSHLKMGSKATKINTLIVNAAECEPYITCDDMVMRERSEDLINGIELVESLLGAKNTIIGIEDNKPEALSQLQFHTKSHKNISIKVVPTIYPSGDAKRLIFLINGIKIPKGKRSSEYGIQMFNVATIIAIYRYISFGEPSLSRITTISGNITKPQNYEVLFGTPLKALINQSGGQKIKNDNFIMGGPMMGFKLPSIDVPVTKAMNCVLGAEPEMIEDKKEPLPCIRCAKCAEACPVSLQPQELYWFSKSDQFEKAQEYKLFDCIECGCCSYVCPSNIPLVQFYRYAKSELISEFRAQEEADVARERNEFRIMRLERERQERAERNAKRRAQSSKEEKSKLIDEKRAAISAAMDRIKEYEKKK